MDAPEEVKPRIVFDTSVVISVLALQSGRLVWLRAHWRDRRCIPLISRETAQELIDVLQYPKFHLGSDEINEVLADYIPFCETLIVRKPCPIVCRDNKDQPFLDLAHSGKADLLVTGDRDLLALAGKTKFVIETPGKYRLRALGS